jgi:hypothetical protein
LWHCSLIFSKLKLNQMEKLQIQEMALVIGGKATTGTCVAGIFGGIFGGAVSGARVGAMVAPSPQGLLVGAAAGAIVGGIAGGIAGCMD